MVFQEFQAIVLAAGRGTRLPEVIGDMPKCLLPIGPYPLLWYPLNMLQKHNMPDAIVVVFDDEKSEIQQALDRTPLKMKLDLVTIPANSDFGTADSLRYLHDKIKCDVLVVSCDIVTNVNLYPLINKFRQHDATVCTMFFKSGFENDSTLPGSKSKQKPERDVVGIQPETKRLLFLAAISDFEDVVNVDAHLMRKYDKMTVYSRLLDSHVYVIKRSALDYLTKKAHLSTVKGEFLPYIIKKQLFKKETTADENCQSEVGVNFKAGDNDFSHSAQTKIDQYIMKASVFNDTLTSEPYNGDSIRCYAMEADKGTFGVRVNTSLAFFALNQKLPTIWSDLCGTQELPLVSPSAVVNSTQVKNIAVADNAKLLEKTSLNNSTFSGNCIVNSKNIVNNSIVMPGAVIEECCNIDSCIIGTKAVIKRGSTLKNCLIGPKYVVDEGSKKQMQHLTNADAFMEIDIQ